MLLPSALSAQSVATTSNVDFNGNRVVDYSVATSKSAKRTETTELSDSINGRLVPKEQIESRILNETATEKVTESFDRKFDPNGQLISTERVLTTETKLPGGSTSASARVYRSDVNGSMQEAERRVTETHPTGPGATAAHVTIARPTANGSFEKLEERKILKSVDPKHTHEDETVYLKSNNGDLVAARRNVTDTDKSGDTTKTTTASYETDYTGRMSLLKSENSTAVLGKDGKEVVERNIYGADALGAPRTGQDGQKIAEQDIVVRSPGADGSVKETVSVRRPTPSDPGRLGAPVQISETMCTGKCQPEKP
jgi:hypothetical protein